MKQIRAFLLRRGWTPVLAVVGLMLTLAGGLWQTQTVRSRQGALERLQVEAADLHRAAEALPPGGELVRLRGRGSGELQQEVATLLGLLGQDLAALKVQDRAMTTGAPRVRGDFEVMSVEVSFRAPFETVHVLLDRLRDYGPVVRVDKLVLGRDAGVLDAAGVGTTLSLEVCVSRPGGRDGKTS